MIISQTLQTMLPHMHISTSPKNFNGELGMSLSVFEITNYTPNIVGLMKALFQALLKIIHTKPSKYPTILVLEYGIDHPGEMAFLLTITKPHISVHTQIDSVHSMQFGDPHAIAKEEFLLQQNTK